MAGRTSTGATAAKVDVARSAITISTSASTRIAIEAPFGWEVDIGSGSVPACATIVDSDVARRRIEELIRVWWTQTYPRVAAPARDLTGHLPIRLSGDDSADPGEE
ncbi:MAG: hypothetical protein ACREKH_17020 [Candidatus Rokuibacteriota bacterium]